VALPRFTELHAPAGWRTIEFISDLHLQQPRCARSKRGAPTWRPSRADALFILGDLFEVWVGDTSRMRPVSPPIASPCCMQPRTPAGVHHARQPRLPDGDGLMRSCGGVLLDDPTVLFFRQSTLAAHAWRCAVHLGHQVHAVPRARAIRGVMRDFLAKPLAEREAIGRQLREQSEARKAQDPLLEYGQVDDPLARAWLDAADATTMIHGHTHQPREHDLGDGKRRVVLTDWDLGANPPRREVLRWTLRASRESRSADVRLAAPPRRAPADPRRAVGLGAGAIFPS